MAGQSVPQAPEVAKTPPGSDTHVERGLELAELILTRSMQAGLGPGGQLPTERQLAQDLGVTRSAIRYALGIMEAQGHISREVGRGTYLRQARPSGDGPGGYGAGGYGAGGYGAGGYGAGGYGAGGYGAARRGAAAPGQPMAGGHAASGAGGGQRQPASRRAADQADPGQSAFAPADVMMVRRLLEPPAMPLAVAWATAGDFAEMDRCLAGGDRAASYEEFEAWDLALHRSIIAATHSPLLVTLYGSIEAARHGHIWGDLKRRSASAERRRLYQADHHDIVAALKARDSGGAVSAMRAHLARVSDHLNATDPAAGMWH
jgi:DNA-binding FadR family transcriptional regulator